MDIAERKKILIERMHNAREIAKNASEAALKLEGAIELLTDMEQEQAREQKIDRPKAELPAEGVSADRADNRSADSDNDSRHAADGSRTSGESASRSKLDEKKQAPNGKSDRSGTVSDMAAARA